jgi:hypothetical protein
MLNSSFNDYWHLYTDRNIYQWRSSQGRLWLDRALFGLEWKKSGFGKVSLNIFKGKLRARAGWGQMVLGQGKILKCWRMQTSTLRYEKTPKEKQNYVKPLDTAMKQVRSNNMIHVGHAWKTNVATSYTEISSVATSYTEISSGNGSDSFMSLLSFSSKCKSVLMLTISRPDIRVKHGAYGHSVATLLNPLGGTVSHKYSHATVVVAVPSTVHSR